MMEQSTLEKFTKKATIKHTSCPGNAGSISKRISSRASIKKRKKTIERREVC